MSTATIQAAWGTLTPSDGLPLAERLDPALGTVDVFRRLARLPHAVFFDSAMRHPQLGRFSFIAADPLEWIESTATDAQRPLELLERKLLERRAIGRTDLPPFQGGWAGLFSYDLGRGLESIPAALIDEFQVPRMAVGLYDIVIAFDHEQGAAWIVSQGWPATDVAARREQAKRRIAWLRALIEGSNGMSAKEDRTAVRWPAAAACSLAPQHELAGISGLADLTSSFSPDTYRRAVEQAIEYIRAGDVFQVNLAQRLLHPARLDSIDLYLRLRECSPAPFSSYFDAGPWQICSASPERFLKVQMGRVETRPIKGTRPRSAAPVEDQQAADALLASAKDRAENVMIVDLLRNDLSRTCRPESVRVSQLCGLESYTSVHHLVSAVEGELRDCKTPLDVLTTCLPGGSVTGAPKLRAMEIISELEPTARGAYCGALGYIGVDGRMDLSVLIRTITAGRGWWQLPVGGGIVAQSDPDAEYAETWHKAEGMLRAIGR